MTTDLNNGIDSAEMTPWKEQSNRDGICTMILEVGLNAESQRDGERGERDQNVPE